MVYLSAFRASAGSGAAWTSQLAATGITMSPIFANIEFAKPAFLWLLIALPIIWIRLRDRRLAVLIVRTLIIALVDSDAGRSAIRERESRTEARIFAFDVSDSVPASLRQWMKESRNGLAAPKPNDHVYAFGSTAAEVTDWRERLDGDRSKSSDLQPEKTNLESLLKSRPGNAAWGRETYTCLPTAGRPRETSSVYCRQSQRPGSRFIRSYRPDARRSPTWPYPS